LAAFVLSECTPREPGGLVKNISDYVSKLVEQYGD